MERKLAVIFSLLLSGCGSLASRGLLPDVEARRPAAVRLGAPLILAESTPSNSASLIAADGSAHIFFIDPEKRLRHVEALNDAVAVDEIVGPVENAEPFALDAIEASKGVFRVLAGDRQFVRGAGPAGWQEIKGNRCERFFRAASKLFCAFVISGEEIGTPPRKDWTVGWFILMPVAWWSHSQGAKLVLAEFIQESWTIRAVVDAASLLDANHGFMADMDRDANLHFLYFDSRGGGVFALVAGPAPGAIGGGFKGPAAELKYARTNLLPLAGGASTVSGPDASSAARPARDSIAAANLTARAQLGRLNKRAALNSATGEISALLWGHLIVTGSGATRRFDLVADSGDCCSWIEARIKDGDWLSTDEIVATPDLPEADYQWHGDDGAVLEADEHGDLHALLEHIRPGFWSASYFMAYFTKTGGVWSAPVTLGSGSGGGTRAIATGDSGESFAAWVDAEGRFNGRWIRPVAAERRPLAR